MTSQKLGPQVILHDFALWTVRQHAMNRRHVGSHVGRGMNV
jgi:hypothetical protein